MALGYTSKVVGDYLGQTDTRDAARKSTTLHQHISREHDGQTGEHLSTQIRSSGGTVSESGGSYTLRDSFGLVDSIAKIGTGQIRVTLSGSGLALGPGDSAYWYPVDAMIHDAVGICRVDARTATTFDVFILDVGGTVQEAGFSFTLGGLPA